MTDKPIVFSAPMVRALLDGRKTQTRRVLKPQPEVVTHGHVGALGGGCYPYRWLVSEHGPTVYGSNPQDFARRVAERTPYAEGDRLWVREQWSGPHAWRETLPRNRQRCGSPTATQVWYWADGEPDHGDWERPRSPAYMPRWASRITLLVTDVRVQRVQDISAEDAMAEGGPPLGTCNDWVAAYSFERLPA
jgi:hypothetical protein